MAELFRRRVLPLVIIFLLTGRTPSAAVVAPPAETVQEESLLATGSAMLEKGEYTEALALFSSRLQRVGTADRGTLEAFRYLTLFYWYADLDLEAVETCQSALDLAARSGLRADVTSIKTRLAILEFYVRASDLRAKGDIVGSDLAFERALILARAGGETPYELKVLRARSANYLGSGSLTEKYLDLNARALELALSLGYRREACRAENNQGAYYNLRGFFSQALSHFLKAYSYILDSKPNDDTLKCLSNIALVRISIGDFAKAYDDLSEALGLIGRSDGLIRSSVVQNLGQTLLSLAERSQDPEYYQKAVECFSSYAEIQNRAGQNRLGVHALNGAASIYLSEGRTEEAKSLLLSALASIKADRTSPLAGMILNNLGATALREGQTVQAEQYFKQVLQGARKNNDVLRMIRAHYGLGRCAEQRSMDESAISSYNEAVRLINENSMSIVNDVDRAEFISRSREPFQALIDLCFRLSRKAYPEAFEKEIFRVAENFRARSFLEHLENRVPQTGTGHDGEVPREKAALELERLEVLKELSANARTPERSKAAALETRIKRIDDLLDALVFDGRSRQGAPQTQAPPVSLSVLQSAVLPDRTAMLEYFLGEDRSFLIYITKSTFRLLELPPAQTIEDSLTAYLSFLEDPSLPAGRGLPAAQRIYKELVGPALDRAAGDIDRLIIIPDGVLYQIPFEALVSDGSKPRSPIYMNDLYAISYAPSASFLLYLKRLSKPAYRKEILAVGVADYGPSAGPLGSGDMASANSILNDVYERSGFALGPIPFARTEIDSLAERARPEKADLYCDERATETALKRLDLAAYRIIHFACHALSDKRYPLRSSLVLYSGGHGPEDGFLQVSEMYSMKTSADLIVLSACQTGTGKIAVNEGISGLPRIFFYMGARSLISTLWPIHDRATVVFMGYFYDSYFRGAGKSESLRAAKMKMLRTRFAHPYFWAPYTLTGEY